MKMEFKVSWGLIFKMVLDLPGIPNMFPRSRESNVGVQKKREISFTKEFFAQAGKNIDAIGTYAVNTLATGNFGRTTFMMPSDFTEIIKATLVVVAFTGHNDWDLDIEVRSAKKNEAFNGNLSSDSIAPDLQSQKMEEVDITNLMNKVVAESFVGIQLHNDQGVDDLEWLGVRIKYE